MTRIVIISSTPSPLRLDSNACAVPWKSVVMLSGRVAAASLCTSASALPSETPGATSNEIVADGSCPEWLTCNGPSDRVNFTSVSSGTSAPLDDRTYSNESVPGSAWYCGSTSMMTQYSSLG